MHHRPLWLQRNMGADEKTFLPGWREILVQIKDQKPKEYFVYFEVYDLRSCAERSASGAEKDLHR